MGVGGRRLIAGPPVAHGPGVGARALRPHTKAAVTADARDAAATAADGDDVDHRHLDREASDRAVRGDRRRAALDQAHVGAGSTDVRGQDAVVAGRHGERAGAERAGGGPGQDGRDGMLGHLAGGDDPAVRLHHIERHVRVKLAREPLVDGADVAGNPALDERVDEGRHRPLVLAVLREHVGRDGHVRLWQLARDDLAHTPLVFRVGVGVDEADADRGQPLLA